MWRRGRRRRKTGKSPMLRNHATNATSVEEMGRFVSSLGKGGEVKVLGASRGPAGRLIQSMFRYF